MIQEAREDVFNLKFLFGKQCINKNLKIYSRLIKE